MYSNHLSQMGLLFLMWQLIHIGCFLTTYNKIIIEVFVCLFVYLSTNQKSKIFSKSKSHVIIFFLNKNYMVGCTFLLASKHLQVGTIKISSIIENNTCKQYNPGTLQSCPSLI